VDAPIEDEQNWSIETWMKFHQKPSSGSQFMFLLNNSANKNLFLLVSDGNDNGKFTVEIDGASSNMEVNEASVFDQQFHHFYIEGDGSKVRLYIDGNEKGSIDFTGKFPNSDKKMDMGGDFDGNMDEIRIRGKSGFPGVPSARYTVESQTKLLYQFDDQSTTAIMDNSGLGNHGTINGTAAYEDDVYAGGGGGGGTQGINLTVTSNETLNNEEILVGFMGPGQDPNYWANRSWDHSLGNYTFPGSHQFLIPRSDLLDGSNYHLLVFADLNNDKMLDDATEHNGTSMPFSISGGIGNAGNINLNAPGGGGGGGTQVQLQAQINIQKDYESGNLHLWVNKEGEDPMSGQSVWGEIINDVNPPYDELKTFTIDGMVTGNRFYLVGHFDANSDNVLDHQEPSGVSELFNIPPGGPVNLKIQEQVYTDSVEVVIKSIAPFVSSGNLWLAFYEGENVNQIEALPGLPNNPIFWERILDFDQIPVTDATYTFKDEFAEVQYDSGYAFVAWYDTGGGFSDDFDVSYDPYSWGTFHVNRQSIEQGNRLKLEMHLHFIPGPQITPPSASSIQANKGEELQLSFSASASQLTGSEVEYAEVHYWVGLESGIEGKYMGANNNGDGTWTAMIPAYDLTMGGLAIQYGAEDKIGVWSWTSPIDVQVTFPDLAFEPHFMVTAPENYEMISVPALLQNSSSDAVLADELGAYDKKKWRLFKWSNGQYVESNVSFNPGAAYWLITKNEEQINTGPGKTTRIFSTIKRNLSDGWNMVGNPYIFPINLAENVVFSQNVEPTLYQWNGSSYNNTTNMIPKGGNWVFSNGSGTMEFFPMWGPGSQSEAIPEGTANDEEDFNWKAKIITKAGNHYDETATFGVHESASDTWDRFDYHEPPVIGNYISMAFENDYWAENGGRYSQDIRSEGRTQTWNLAARSNIKGIVSLSLEDVHAIPSHQDVRLVDPVLGIVYNLRSEKAVTFTSQGTENPYYFKLIVGATDDIQSQLDDMGMVPNDFELFQNTPNPFNPVTNIRVSLVEDARITLKVYNLLGKEVNTLAFNQSLSKGNHRFIWAGKDDNGRQLPSGVYLYRIEINSHVGRQLYQSTKKMVLMK
ncbi:MAG TPA: T9SS type A sorting domain-containing protein, partial [Candidatus Marinimicrobia bacterium]|nr:T9SS type A sorting domain-containing protein [Candidatus Neomarinimicrobiota bacterium]